MQGAEKLSGVGGRYGMFCFVLRWEPLGVCFYDLVGFLELRRQCGVSHEVRRGAQGASRVAPGKSGVYACDEEEPINALESW